MSIIIDGVPFYEDEGIWWPLDCSAFLGELVEEPVPKSIGIVSTVNHSKAKRLRRQHRKRLLRGRIGRSFHLDLSDPTKFERQAPPLADLPQDYNDEDIGKLLEKFITSALSYFNLETFQVVFIVSHLFSIILHIVNMFSAQNLTLAKTHLLSMTISFFSGLAAILSLDHAEKLQGDIKQAFEEFDLSSPIITDSQIDDLNKLHSKIDILQYIQTNRVNLDITLLGKHIDCLAKLQPKYKTYLLTTFSTDFFAAYYSISKEEASTFIKTNLIYSERQSVEWVSKSYTLVTRGLGIFFAWVIAQFSSTSFSARDAVSGLTLGRELEGLTGDMVKDLTDAITGKDQIKLELIDAYSETFLNFLHTPAYKFARDHRQLYRVKDLLKQCTEFSRSYPNDQRNNIVPLTTLANAASKRLSEIFQNQLHSMSRQEPFVVLLTGKGAIGKTTFARHLIQRTIAEILEDGTQSQDYISIRSDDKYWPPLSGQRVAFFDEAGSVRDYSKDLLFRGIKGICSPDFYNCDGADLAHKVSPCPFHVIYASTNTTMEDIQERVSATFSRDSVFPVWRRIIAIDCIWNKERCGELNPNDPAGHRADFSHLELVKYEFDEQTSRMKRCGPLTPDSLFELIRTRYTAKFNHFITQSTRDMERQAGHMRMHYSVHLSGPPGQGKTPMIAQTASELSQAFHLPIYKPNNLSELLTQKLNRGIFIFDDIFDTHSSPELYQEFMHIYNSVIPDSSILLFASNIPISFSFIPRYNLTKLSWLRKHYIPIQGAVRRLGMVGNFVDHDTPIYNSERYVTKGVCHEIVPTEFDIITYTKAWHRGEWRTLLGLSRYLPLVAALAHPYALPLALLYLAYLIFPRYTLRPSQDCTPMCYEGYKAFLTMRGDFVMEQVAVLPDAEWNFRVDIPHLDRFDYTGGYGSLFNRVYTDLQAYESEKEDWKLWIEPNTAARLSGSAERFLITSSNLTYENCVYEMKRCARMFQEYGEPVAMQHKIDGIGTFAIIGNTFYEVVGQQETIPVTCFVSGEDLIVCSNNLNKIPIRDIMADVNIPHKYNLSISESKTLYSYIVSDEYLTNPAVAALYRKHATEVVTNYATIKALEVRDALTAWIKTPFGRFSHICYTLAFTCITLFITYNLLSWLLSKVFGPSSTLQPPTTPEYEEQAPVRRVKTRHYDSDAQERQAPVRRQKARHYDSDCEHQAPIRRQKARHYDSDCEQQAPVRRQKARHYDSDAKDSKKIERQSTGLPQHYDEDGNPIDIATPTSTRNARILQRLGVEVERQSINTLEPISYYDAFKPLMHAAYEKGSYGLSALAIMEDTGEKRGLQKNIDVRLYGVFVKDRVLVTVGHVVRQLRGPNGKGSALYVGNDAFGEDTYYRLRLVKHFAARELSFWEVESKQCIQFPSLKKLFFKRGELEHDQILNVLLERFGPRSILNVGECQITRKAQNILGETQMEFGCSDFGTNELCFTRAGDCGLPYYSVNARPANLSNKILGIHFGGNREYTRTTGLVSVIYQEDIESLDGERQAPVCQWDGLTENLLLRASEPKCEHHNIMWNAYHDVSPLSFEQEVGEFIRARPTFEGVVIKNAGKLYGSEKHSHTQFLWYEELELGECAQWKTATAAELEISPTRLHPDTTLSYMIGIVDYPYLSHVLRKLKPLHYRVYAWVYRRGGKHLAKYRIIVLNEIPQHDLKQIERQSKGLSSLTLPNREEVYVCEEIYDFLNPMIKRHERGVLPDIPFERLSNNDTCISFGTSRKNHSINPKANYQRTAFAKTLNLDPIKVPVNFNLEQAPPEILDQIAEDRQGKKSQRVTSSLQWARPWVEPDAGIRSLVKREFANDILHYYSGLTLLTDKQILSGYKQGHPYADCLSGLETNSAVGITLRNLYTVQKKSDVLEVSELGEYSWKKNMAADFAQEQLKISQEQASKGERYLVLFNELLKMEKIKPSKEFLPRSFTGPDLNGILMERWIMGDFCARAMKDDPVVCIGMNFYTDFNKLFLRLCKHPNMFTLDYAKFDRTIPQSSFDDFRDILITINPHMRNEIYSCFESLSARIQVSGSTVFFCKGGMPSGCLVTAPLNSKLNHMMTFGAYISLCRKTPGFEKYASYHWYKKFVVAVFYGDDGWMSVADEIKEVFNAVTLAQEMKHLYGMDMTPSSKSGTVQPFESLQEMSFVSRFPRQLDSYPFWVGALKKISINSLLMWTVDNSPAQVATQLDSAQYEAALWEQSYFDEIQKSIRIALKIQPKLADYFSFRTRASIQEEIFYSASHTFMERHTAVGDVENLNIENNSLALASTTNEINNIVASKTQSTDNDNRTVYKIPQKRLQAFPEQREEPKIPYRSFNTTSRSKRTRHPVRMHIQG